MEGQISARWCKSRHLNWHQLIKLLSLSLSFSTINIYYLRARILLFFNGAGDKTSALLACWAGQPVGELAGEPIEPLASQQASAMSQWAARALISANMPSSYVGIERQ